MRWINAIGIVPLAMIMAAVMARLSRPAEGRVRAGDPRDGGRGRA